MRKAVTLILFSFVFISGTIAQKGYYRAIVYNYKDGEPLEGVKIFLDTVSDPIGVTDSNGFFAVLISSGKHSIRIDAKDKVEQTRQISIKKDLILSESIFLFASDDDIVNCDSINSPKFSDKSFLKNSDTIDINGNKIFTADAFIRIGYDKEGVRATMTVILPVNYLISAKDEIEITQVYVSYNGMLYTTDEIITRSGLHKIQPSKEETVFFVNFQSPPWTGENVEVILEILNSGKKQYLRYNKGISIYPSEER